MMKTNSRGFHSAGSARSLIRYVAYEFSDLDSMQEYFALLDITNAALVTWLIEESEAGFSSPMESGESEDFRLAVERLRTVLRQLRQT
jgi:hypothetical protein